MIWASKSKKSKPTFNYKTAKNLNIELTKSGDKKQMGSVWEIGICQGNERLKNDDGTKTHSTQKPWELLYRIIVTTSKINDIVLDPFGGTMTTAAVAKATGRNYISFEKEVEYFNAGLKRVKKQKILIGDIEKAIFDNKPIKASISDMILKNFLIVGQEFWIGDKFAILNDEGKLFYAGDIYDIHSLCAIFKNSKSARLNGYDHWIVKVNQDFIKLSIIREKYREKYTID